MHAPAHHQLLARVPLAGWYYHRGEQLRPPLQLGERLALVPEPDNPHDASAIAVYARGTRIGYVPADRTRRLGRLARRSDLHVHVSDGYEAEDTPTYVVTELELWAPAPEVLRKLTTPTVPGDADATPLLSAHDHRRLLTLLPPALTAAGRRADADARIGWRPVCSLSAHTGGRYDAYREPPRWAKHQRLYLVREAATASHHERVSVWLPGSRLVGFLARASGRKLLRRYAEQRGPYEQWCALALSDFDGGEDANADVAFGLLLVGTTHPDFHTAEVAEKMRGRVLISELRAPDLLRLAPGARRDHECLSAPVPRIDAVLQLSRVGAPGSGDGGAVDYVSTLDPVAVPPSVRFEVSRQPAPPAIAHLPLDVDTDVRWWPGDNRGVPRGRYTFATPAGGDGDGGGDDGDVGAS